MFLNKPIFFLNYNLCFQTNIFFKIAIMFPNKLSFKTKIYVSKRTFIKLLYMFSNKLNLYVSFNKIDSTPKKILYIIIVLILII